jgi:hypothetical protein
MAFTAVGLWLGSCATSGEPSLLSSDRASTLSPAEQNWPCPNITNALNVHVTKIITLQAQGKAELESAPRTILSALNRLAGADNPMASRIEPERAAADAYNALLRRKGCPTVDIDARLAAPRATPVLAAADSKPLELPVEKLRK